MLKSLKSGKYPDIHEYQYPQALLVDACYLLLPVADSTLYAQGCTPAPQPR